MTTTTLKTIALMIVFLLLALAIVYGLLALVEIAEKADYVMIIRR